jgi:sialidase-1
MKALFTILFLAISLVVYSQTENVQSENGIPDFKNLFDAKTQPGIFCYRIPAIITATNGDLIAAIDERVPSSEDLRTNKDINIVIRRSVDNGDSWSEIETIVDYPFGKSASDPSMIVDKTTGAIFLFFNFMDLDNENGVYYLRVIKSMDNGQTWSSPINITSQIAKSKWHRHFKFISSGRVIQNSCG